MLFRYITHIYREDVDIMEKDKYKRCVNGYYRAKVWDGTYNPDGTKHHKCLKSDSRHDLEKMVEKLRSEVMTVID